MHSPPLASLVSDLPHRRLAPLLRLIYPRQQHRPIAAPGNRNHGRAMRARPCRALRRMARCSRECGCCCRPKIAPGPGPWTTPGHVHQSISDHVHALGSCLHPGSALRVADAVNNNNRRVRSAVPLAEGGLPLCQLALGCRRGPSRAALARLQTAVANPHCCVAAADGTHHSVLPWSENVSTAPFCPRAGSASFATHPGRGQGRQRPHSHCQPTREQSAETTKVES
jgi:hypothetical protein